MSPEVSAARVSTWEVTDRPAGIDVKLTSRFAGLDASIGRKARLQGSPREGPKSAPEQTFLFVCSDLVGDRPAERRSSARPSRGRAPSKSWALTSLRAEIAARPQGRIRAPIDKVEPTVDTAGP